MTHKSLAERSSNFHVRQFGHEEVFHCLVANETGAKVAVVVHGITGNKRDMALIAEGLAKRGYAVYCPDLPGHDATDPLDNLQSFSSLGQWLERCIGAIGKTPDILIGNSFGSAVCYSYAQQGFLPSRAKLILGCPTPDVALKTRFLREASGFLPQKLMTKLYNSRPGIWLRVIILSQTPKGSSARAWLYESEYHKVSLIDTSICHVMSKLLDQDNPYKAGELSEDVQRRTVVMVGDRDNVLTRKSLKILRQLLPNARFDIISGAGHLLHFEAIEDTVGHAD
jgi:pimeloyl-ACP methyl ester carboxylesterase